MNKGKFEDERLMRILQACRASQKAALIRGVVGEARALVVRIADREGLPLLDVAAHYASDLRGHSGVLEERADGTKVSGRVRPDWAARMFDAEPKIVLLGEVETYPELSATNRSVLYSLLKDRRYGSDRLSSHVWLLATALQRPPL